MIVKSNSIGAAPTMSGKFDLDEVQAMLTSGGYVSPQCADQVKKQIAWLKRNSVQASASRTPMNTILILAVVLIAVMLFMRRNK